MSSTVRGTRPRGPTSGSRSPTHSCSMVRGGCATCCGASTDMRGRWRACSGCKRLVATQILHRSMRSRIEAADTGAGDQAAVGCLSLPRPAAQLTRLRLNSRNRLYGARSVTRLAGAQNTKRAGGAGTGSMAPVQCCTAQVQQSEIRARRGGASKDRVLRSQQCCCAEQVDRNGSMERH